MFLEVIMWSIPIGIIHFALLGALYGNSYIDKFYSYAQDNDVGVKKWNSKVKYLSIQYLGTQIEVIIIVFAYIFLKDYIPFEGLHEALVLGLLFTAIRVYPRFWNMWIQSTYPIKLLFIEAINGTIGTLAITISLELLR